VREEFLADLGVQVEDLGKCRSVEFTVPNLG
jgi:hypothetical protein